MYHSFLNHSSAHGHLGCFRVLAVINSAVMNTGVHMSLSILVFSVCMPSSGIAVLSVQFSSVAQSRPTLCDPMNRSMPGLPVHHQLLEFTQDSRPSSQWCHQPSHSLLSPSPPAPNPSQHQSIFQWVNSSHEVAKVLEFQLKHHSFQRNPRADFL